MGILLSSDNDLVNRPRIALTTGGTAQEVWTPMQAQTIPPGYCQCGCGLLTRISPVSDASKGWIRGVPRRYLKDHGQVGLPRGSAHAWWKGDDITYEGAHKRLKYYAVKTGICEGCGPVPRTEWAYKGEPGGWSGNISDYREMCRSCHRRYDVQKADRATGGPCSAEGCDRRAYSRKLCRKHYTRWYRRMRKEAP